MDDESLNIHGVFKAILGLVAVSMVANIVFLFLSSEKIDLLYSHSPFYALALIFFGVIFPTVIAAMAFKSLRDHRGDTLILLQTYMIYMMSDCGIGVEGDKRISAHRKSYLYYTEPYRTMVDVVLLRDYRTPKYCIVYGVYEEGTGSHTMEVVDAVRFQ